MAVIFWANQTPLTGVPHLHPHVGFLAFSYVEIVAPAAQPDRHRCRRHPACKVPVPPAGHITTGAESGDAHEPVHNAGRNGYGGERYPPRKIGVFPLRGGHDALASRLALIAAAEASIDAQYYIWHDDTSGILLLDALYQAARRGVRVRLLLDDNGVPGLDGFMATLNTQENFEIRLFNPSTIRNPKSLGYTFDFFRMNRRMHNKSLIADGAVAILGGRNIGDEYFEVGDDNFYVDMDVLAAGAIVPETAAIFDAYWNSPSVFEAEKIIREESNLPVFEARSRDIRKGTDAIEFLNEASDSATEYAKGNSQLE